MLSILDHVAAIARITDAFNDARQPSYSPDGKWIAFFACRDGSYDLWAIGLADGTERKLATAAGRVDAPSWGPGGALVYHVSAGAASGPGNSGPNSARYEIGGTAITGTENVFGFRASWANAKEFYYVVDGTAAGARRGAPGDLTGRQADRVCRHRRHLWHASWWQAGEPH